MRSVYAACQSLPDPGSSLFRRREDRGRYSRIALAEPRLQVPVSPVLRVMGPSVEAHDHAGELIVRKDEPTFAVMAVNEHFYGLECDIERHGALRTYRREHTHSQPPAPGKTMLAIQVNNQQSPLFGTTVAQHRYCFRQ